MSCRPRSIRRILALPLDDQEERQARQYINRECAEIRASWSEQEHRIRAGLRFRPPPWRPPQLADLVALLDHDDNDD